MVVVDRLKPVEIDHPDDDMLAGGVTIPELACLLQTAAVQQTRELVMTSQTVLTLGIESAWVSFRS